MTSRQCQINQVLRDEDIEGFIGLGAPPDEYESEADMIAGAIASEDQSKLTEGRITDVIRTVWAKMFGPFSEEELGKREDAFRRVARCVLAARTSD